MGAGGGGGALVLGSTLGRGRGRHMREGEPSLFGSTQIL